VKHAAMRSISSSGTQPGPPARSAHSASTSRVNRSGVSSLTRILMRALYLFVAPPEAVVHAQDRVEVVQDLGTRQEIANDMADDGRATEPPRDENAEADFAGFGAHRVDPDVVHERRGTVLPCTETAILKFARQVGELGCSVDHCRMTRTRTADRRSHPPATPAKWSPVTLRMQCRWSGIACISTLPARRECRNVGQLRPVELDVLPRGEVAVTRSYLRPMWASVRSCREREQAIRHCDAQHRRVASGCTGRLQTQRSKSLTR